MNKEQKEHIESMEQVVREELKQCKRGIELIEMVERCKERDEEHLGAMIAVLKDQSLECEKGVKRLKAQVLKYEGVN